MRISRDIGLRGQEFDGPIWALKWKSDPLHLPEVKVQTGKFRNFQKIQIHKHKQKKKKLKTTWVLFISFGCT